MHCPSSFHNRASGPPEAGIPALQPTSCLGHISPLCCPRGQMLTRTACNSATRPRNIPDSCDPVLSHRRQYPQPLQGLSQVNSFPRFDSWGPNPTEISFESRSRIVKTYVIPGIGDFGMVQIEWSLTMDPPQKQFWIFKGGLIHTGKYCQTYSLPTG